ncbi:MAG TPA: CHAD domain-containing protein [Gaiellaceae bacterium]
MSVAREANGRPTLRLSFEPGFRLPELPGRELEPRVFTTTYFDSDDRALAGSRLTLRRRVENGKSIWRLRSGAGSGLDLEVAGGPAGPPAELSDLLVGIMGARTLQQAAKVRVRRSGLGVREGRSEVAVIVVDDVTVLDGRRVVERFKELRVETVADDADLLDRLETLLHDAGAFSAGDVPRLAEVIGMTPEKRDLKGSTAPVLFTAILQDQLREILAHDPGTRLGTDPEELHDMRVATRRARALLKTTRPLLEPAWTESARAELSWLGGALGAVRDLDVFLERLQAEVAQLDPKDRRAGRKVIQAVEIERDAAREALVAALSSDRYQALLRTLGEGVARPPLLPVDVDLRELAAKQFAKLRKRMSELGPDPSDELVHRARIKAKRARYAAEVVAAGDGKATRRFVKVAKRFQDVAGEHQDAVVADERLRELALEAAGATTAFVAGRLAERERDRRRAARAELPRAWRSLARAGKKAWA